MDNLPAHQVAGVQGAIQSAQASPPHLPPYRPDRNPIEQVFARLKALLKKAAVRIKDAPWQRIASLLGAFTPKECSNYIMKLSLCVRSTPVLL